MDIRDNIGRVLKNIYYQLKGIGPFVLVPILVLYVLIPFVNFSVYYASRDMEILFSNILEICQMLCPLCSVWYVLFILYHFVEQPGCEVLYTLKKNKLLVLICSYLCFSMIMYLLFFVYTIFFQNLWWLYLKLCVISLFYLSVAYCTAFLTKNITVGTVFLLIYSMLNVMESDIVEKISYYNSWLNTGKCMIMEILPFFWISIFLLCVGNISNHYYCG